MKYEIPIRNQNCLKFDNRLVKWPKIVPKSPKFEKNGKLLKNKSICKISKFLQS